MFYVFCDIALVQINENKLNNMADEDEIDVLGDSNLNNFLAKSDVIRCVEKTNKSLSFTDSSA